MKSTACFGSCPIYALTFRADGTVEYEGDSFVAARGRRTTVISPAEFSALVRKFDAIGYETLTWGRDCRGKFVTDHPIVLTSLTRGGKTHAIKHNLGDGCAPQELGEIEDALRAAVGPSLLGWIRCDGRCLQ
jgi:hypothetical protein